MSAYDADIWRVLGEISLPWSQADLSSDLGRKHVALVAILVIAGRPVSREHLATLLWPESDRQAARHNLRQALVSIRKALGARADDAIVADPDGVALRQDAVRTDIGRLREIAAGHETSPDEVLDLCRGPLLDGFALASPAFEEQLELWRQEADTLALTAIDQVFAGARARKQDALLARRQIFASRQADQEAAQTQGLYSSTAEAERRGRLGRRWHRTVLAVFAGLALGGGVIFAAFAASPEFRSFIAIMLEPKAVDRLTVRPFTPGNDTMLEQKLARLLPGTLSYGLQAIPERKLGVVRAADDPTLASLGDKEFAQRMEVRYVISGTVEHDRGTVRVTVRCFDEQLDADVWSDRFEKPVTDPFELPDLIATEIVSELDIDLTTAERNRLQYLNDTDSLEAWLLAVNGVSNLIKLTLGGLREANMSYSRALELDPAYISARRGVVWHGLLMVRFGMAEDPDATIQEARNHLDVILRHKPDHGMSRALEGFLLLLENSWDDAIPASERASRLLPGSADVSAVLAHSYTYVGENEKALKAVRRAKKLSPGHPAFYNWIEARALRQLGETEQAIALLNQEVSPEEESLVRLVELAAAYMASGREAEALSTAERIRQIDPDFRASRWVLHPAMEDHELQSLEFELLSKAGL